MNMWLNVALLCASIATVVTETIEIACPNCRVRDPIELDPNDTWKFLCDPTCNSIDMPTSDMPRFPHEIFTAISGVRDLRVHGANMKELTFGDFTNAQNLENLTIYENHVSLALGKNCFWGAFGLRKVDLLLSMVAEVHPTAFSSLVNLEEIELGWNRVTHVTNEHFKDLVKLKKVTLHHNSVERIESEVFLYNVILTEIDLSHNALTELDLLLPHVNFDAILAADNQITKFSLRSTTTEHPGVRRLLNVDVSINDITQLYIQLNFPVEALHLYNNTHPDIYRLPPLPSLEILDLDFCEVQNLDDMRLAERYKNLTTLYMRNNTLRSFMRESFADLDELGGINLSYNMLTEVDFPLLKSVTVMTIDHNYLTELPFVDNVRETFPRLSVIYLGQNSFNSSYLNEIRRKLQEQGVNVET